jgi:hypothetical protein
VSQVILTSFLNILHKVPQLERDILLMEEKCETLEEDANRLLAQIQSRLHNLCRQIHAEFQISDSMIGSAEQGNRFTQFSVALVEPLVS